MNGSNAVWKGAGAASNTCCTFNLIFHGALRGHKTAKVTEEDARLVLKSNTTNQQNSATSNLLCTPDSPSEWPHVLSHEVMKEKKFVGCTSLPNTFDLVEDEAQLARVCRPGLMLETATVSVH
jgi:hypothetical protein